MRSIVTILVGAAVLGIGAWTSDRPEPPRAERRLPPAQQVSMHALWDSFFGGCTEGHTDNEYLCACAGTYLLEKCARDGARNEVAFSACIQNQQNIQEAAGRCTAYGNLSNGGMVRPPAPYMPGPEPPGLARLTRLQRWTGSYQGCTREATPAERARAPSMQYTCACLATYIVNACAPNDNVSNNHVAACVARMGNDHLNQTLIMCDQYGSMRSR